MNRQDLLKQMKDSVGTKEPTAFFTQMVDAFDLLFDKIDVLEKEIKRAQLNSVLAIHWDQRIADTMVNDEIVYLRKMGKQADGINLYVDEIDMLQKAYMDKLAISDYSRFCKFWQELLGYHPFLEHRK